MKKFVIAGVVLVVFSIAFLGIVGSLITSKPSPSKTASVPDEQPAFSVIAGSTTYHGAISSDVGVAVLQVQPRAYMAGFGSILRPDGKFIFVTVAIANRQHDAITMSSSLFEIVDPSGNVYSASEKSLEVDPDKSLFLAEINPGITKTGAVIFDVPQDLSLDNLRLRFRGGMTGDPAELALKVDATVVQAAAPAPTQETAEVPSSKVSSPAKRRENEKNAEAPKPEQTKTQNVAFESPPTPITSCPHNDTLNPRDVQESQKFVAALQTVLRTGNSRMFVDLVELPLQLNTPTSGGVSRRVINDPAILNTIGSDIFTSSARNHILEINPSGCLVQGKDGFTMGDGTFWFHRSQDGQFKLFALNR